MVIDFSSLYDIPKEMDQILEMFSHSSVITKRNYPMVNVAESDQAYIVDACLPGAALEDMELTLTANSLVLKAERKSPEGRYYRQERLVGSFQRVISLNVPVARDKVTAKIANGILRVTLPKEEEARPRRISITR